MVDLDPPGGKGLFSSSKMVVSPQPTSGVQQFGRPLAGAHFGGIKLDAKINGDFEGFPLTKVLPCLGPGVLVVSKNSGETPKMDGLNNGKPL